ncbi:MAG TPA: aminoglycoside phosphotransferase family protein [Xanthobacteraceae bacterium]
MFSKYIALWQLSPDGPPIVTATDRLLPVTRQGVPAMLKVAVHAEERAGNRLMSWWDGCGAARVLAADDDAVLLERGCVSPSLADLSRAGRDDEASGIICAVIAKLHAVDREKTAPPKVVPLARWCEELELAATQGGILSHAAEAARDLLASPREMVVLHGDVDHGNVLQFGPRGRLAIDPKGLWGERGFEYANVFCNPDVETATEPGRLARQATGVAAAAGLERARLLRWVLAYAGLSAAWSLGEGEPPTGSLQVAALAAAELNPEGAVVP